LGEENADVRNMLGRIIAANEHLKKRLEATEEKLESQTSQLEGYLAEARTDALTGLSNRRAFDKQMDELYAKHNRTPFPFTLAMVDIDHFKSINDTHGHAVGDAVLRHLAGILRGFSPHCVMAARYGGEEFAMIFEEPLETSAEVMEKVRAMVASKPALVDQLSVPLTLSSGVAELVSGERLGDLFRHADEALYSAKKGGRNQVVRYTSVPTDLRSRPPLMRSETAAANATPKPAGTSTGRGAPKTAANGSPTSPSLRAANSAPSASSATATQAIDELELRVLEHLDGLVQAEARGSASK
jgi:diguanylate cyclase